MRRGHFAAIAPVCPLCRASHGEAATLELTLQTKATEDAVDEGLLQCPLPGCQQEYPIIDGLPILVPDVRAFLSTHANQLRSRGDLSPATEGLLVEAAGPGSPLDATCTQLSSYGWDHYGDQDPAPWTSPGPKREPGSILRLLERGLALASRAGVDVGRGAVVDLGSGPGRATFRLAEYTRHPTVGIDLGVHLMQLASGVAREGRARYPFRLGGARYEWRDFPVSLAGRDQVDFWIGDGVRLPLATGRLGAGVSLNLLDCVYSPLDLLRELARVVEPGGAVILASPYDWTGAATPIEAWIGGHSPRGYDGGDSRAILRRLLTPGQHPAGVDGLVLVADEDAIPWRVRMHDRSTVEYLVHLVVAARG